MNQTGTIWMAAALLLALPAAAQQGAEVVVDDFDRPDSLYHGDGWESLNPGFWQIRNGALRRRLRNVGDRARRTGFPFHWETEKKKPMPVEYDPSLPFGMIWRRDWKLEGNYTIRMEATVRSLRPAGGNPQWRQNQPGYALMGICFGGESLFEGGPGSDKSGTAAWMAAWKDDGSFGIYTHLSDKPDPVRPTSWSAAPNLAPGDKVTFEVAVSGGGKSGTVVAKLCCGDKEVGVACSDVDRAKHGNGRFGVVGRGLLDFQVDRIAVIAPGQKRLDVPVNECHTAYALGTTLKQAEGRWTCRFVSIFRNDGERAEIRIADSGKPEGGWENVPVAGSGAIVSNDFRLNTALVDVTLPSSPAEKTLYYTVWKDGRNVTADPREGFLGRQDYVGRLPRLKAPYRICGLGGHGIYGWSDLPRAEWFQENWVHEQPTREAFRHIEEYGFQVMLWEDDVWYLEMLSFPPSTDDAYKIVTATIAGPTERRQMMRHWNVLNPGDHDHGMDDVKGPEQYIIRHHDDLGQDPEYMRRNFKIVSHLMGGEENPSGTDNPKRWRRWKMPDGDFSLLIVDSRLWRDSQDTKMWDDEGWGHKKNLRDRSLPTRLLLGEEQFAWLSEMIRTDSSPLICVTGINALHTVWYAGRDAKGQWIFDQRNRGAADYAGWVKAAADRVIQLLASRQGVVSVYGDVHVASVMRNPRHRLYECSFGAVGTIGPYGSRPLKPGFGPKMKDFDGRDVEALALYHQHYASPKLEPNRGPKYWNFLEMSFDPRGADPVFGLRIRNMVDAPAKASRGGGHVEDRASRTGRIPACSLPDIKTFPGADVLFTTAEGRPIRGARSLPDGRVPVTGLIDVAPGTRVVVTAQDGERAEALVVTTLPPE